MRIIKTGKIPPKEERIKKCRKCKTIFTYKEKDVLYNFEGDRYVDCPLCGQSQLTSIIWDRKVKQ